MGAVTPVRMQLPQFGCCYPTPAPALTPSGAVQATQRCCILVITFSIIPRASPGHGWTAGGHSQEPLNWDQLPNPGAARSIPCTHPQQG